MGSPPAQPTSRSRQHRWLLVAALLLTGLSMRTAVTSVGAVLDGLERGLHTNSGMAGLITTLPPICFAVLGALAPRMASRTGPHRLLVLSLAAMTIGLLARAVVGSVAAFVVLSVLSLVGSAVANVLMPTLVKWHFPDRIGQMTAVYTTTMAIGGTAAAGLSVPIGLLAPAEDSWRAGIGSWTLLSVAAVLPWLSTLRHDVGFAAGTTRLPATALVRSPTAWMVTLFFAFQSVQAYVAFGWFERFLSAHAISASTAGWMVALLSAMGIPASMIAPMVPARYHRGLVLVLGGCFAAAYAGMLGYPAGAWTWMVLAGIGGGMFPLSLALIGYRTTSAEVTASLSAFAQSIGYVIAACGPLLFGVLHGATGTWTASFGVLWAAVILATITGWLASAPRTVDEELAPRRSGGNRDAIQAR
ncbi:MAG TPA: MFS transporter [Micromonosporaceae bacterium]|jgi:MFS transporter, CP family, cyanate transporter